MHPTSQASQAIILAAVAPAALALNRRIPGKHVVHVFVAPAEQTLHPTTVHKVQVDPVS